MGLVLINSISDTFTPTHSGAIGTWHWEICNCARADGIEPVVISKTVDNSHTPYPWPNTVLIPYPTAPAIRIRGIDRIFRLQQRLTGWGHIHQKAYNIRVAQKIRELHLESGPMVLHNDPELSVFLRKQFPRAFIVSHFYNQNSCHPRFRGQFGGEAKPTLVTAVSDFTARWTEGYYGLEVGSVKTLYNGVDCNRFSPAETGPQIPTINFVGRLSHDKGPDLLLNAALNIAQTQSNFQVQLLGSTFWGGGNADAYTLELEGLAGRLKERGVAVRMPGFINRWALPDELRRADIHVVPSRWDEPFALSTLEGMSTGLATIACSTGGTPEAVEGAGLMFAKDDLDTLTAHLSRLIEDSDVRHRYGVIARERAELFDWKNIWRRLRLLVDL